MFLKSFSPIWSNNKNKDWQIVGNQITEMMELKNENNLFIIEFQSNRIEVCFSEKIFDLKIGDYVIFEADRGEDCGQITHLTTKYAYDKITSPFKKYENMEISLKKIIRRAHSRDIEKIMRKKKLEEEALKLCKEEVHKFKYQMCIKFAEYQWDMNKLTFYFDGQYEIDFRELVKDLYRKYKVRIWMCSLDKSKNKILKKLIS